MALTLRVELAKPNFLEQLRLEREQRRDTTLPPPEPTFAVETTSNNEATTSSPLPPKTKRHLRIRKRHGHEAYSVGTKPLLASNWSDMRFTLRKQSTKQKNIPTSSSSLLNRAVMGRVRWIERVLSTR